MRAWSMRSLIWSITNNASAIGKRAIGLRRGKVGRRLLDRGHHGRVTLSSRAEIVSSTGFFAALFSYAPPQYPGEVVVYEAQTTPLLYLPEIGRRWSGFAPACKVVRVVGTHISMMGQPYVGALASDLRARITEFCAARTA